jgi:hypothetical protein
MTVIPPVVPPLPVKSRFALDLPANAGFGWLAAGWRDLWTSRAEPRLRRVHARAVGGDRRRAVVDRVGLHPVPGARRVPRVRPGAGDRALREEPRARGRRAGELRRMLFPRPASGGQVLFTGALLCGLMLLWMRAAVIIYALFFG